MSIKRYFPAIGTAGFERMAVSGCKRDPRPPPMIIPRTSFIDGMVDLRHGICASHHVSQTQMLRVTPLAAWLLLWAMVRRTLLFEAIIS
jgi:hypothetical protein